MIGLHVLTILLVWIAAVWIGVYILARYFMRKDRTKNADTRDLIILVLLVVAATVLTLV